MTEYSHIPFHHLLHIIDKRILDYVEALFGSRSGMKLSQAGVRVYAENQMKLLIEHNDLLKGDLWGYGINSISNGQEQISRKDVAEIRKINQNGKHHEPYRNLALLLFKIQNNDLFVSTFEIDTVSPKINSTLNQRYSLTDFNYARMRTAGQAIYVDIVLNNVPHPVSFQIETYHFGGYYYAGIQLAKYYITSIEHLALKAKQRSKHTGMHIHRDPRKILFHLRKHENSKNSFGSLSFQLGLGAWQTAERLALNLQADGLVDITDGQVQITGTGKEWMADFLKKQDERIYETIFDDYNFSLLRFLYEHDAPLSFEELPEVLSQQAPRKTNGYETMNLHHMLEIELKQYIDQGNGKYALNALGKKYTEHLAKQKNIPIGLPQQNSSITDTNKTNRVMENEIFISYCWENENHIEQVVSFLNLLSESGYHATMDKKLSHEESATNFIKLMYKAMNEHKWVIVILSSGFKRRADAFEGGVGTEYQLMLNDMANNKKKYIFASFQGRGTDVVPFGLQGYDVHDLSDEKELDRLLQKLSEVPEFEFSEVASTKPTFAPKKVTDFRQRYSAAPSQPIRVAGMNAVQTTYRTFDRLYKEIMFDCWVEFENISGNTIPDFAYELHIPKVFLQDFSGHEVQGNDVILREQIKDKFYPGTKKKGKVFELRLLAPHVSQVTSAKISCKFYGDNFHDIAEKPVPSVFQVKNPANEFEKVELQEGHFYKGW